MKNLRFLLISTLILFFTAQSQSQTPGERVDNFEMFNDIRTDQKKQNSQGDIISQLHRYNPDSISVLYVHDNALYQSIKELINITDTDLFTANKTASKDIEHDLDTFDFSLNGDYATFEITDKFNGYSGIANAGIRKYLTPTTDALIKVMDWTAFGQDSATVFIGKIDNTGSSQPMGLTISPSINNIRLATEKSRLDIFSEGNQSGVGQLFDLTAEAPDGYTVGFESQYKWYGVLEAKMYATSDDKTTNLSVIDVTQDTIRLRTDAGEFNTLQTDSIFQIGRIDAKYLFSIDTTGNIRESEYTSNRDDTGTYAPISFYYPDNIGNRMVAPLSRINEPNRELFTLLGGETSVTLSGTPYSDNTVTVSLNGEIIYQGISEDWQRSTDDITFNSYVGVAGHKLEVKWY